MRVLVPAHVISLLQSELKRAKHREIGGVIVAERVDGDLFQIADLSVQRGGGSDFSFLRDPHQHRAFLNDFFARTNYDYTRFNYLGEWHSHPNVPAVPSVQDVRSMHSIVGDRAVNAPFALLMIVRRRLFGGLDMSATEFRFGEAPRPADVTLSGASSRFRAPRVLCSAEVKR